MMIDQHTALYGVIGNPVRHSLSPALHNAAFSATGLNAVYLAFEAGDIEGCVRGIKALDIKGASVTIPFKTAVIPYLDKINPLARRIGAVNTIVNDNGWLKGYNTDAIGAVKALEEKIDLRGMTCLVIGSGGAARAIGFILKERDVTISIANRSSGRGKELARSLGCPYIPLHKIGETRADVLIQTTPVGMYPCVDQCPVPEQILVEGLIVMDIVYNPFETRLIRLAKARGCITINGISMFIHQAAEQLRLWTGIDPPVGVMSHAVKEALLKQNERN
ncbi:MAG: shikimate dehydrogenase [Desulfobacterales bacterium]|jgi:shikimate dehydrogenase|nr:shikimate dehydrogenase [Pseudomonadota bacterium]MCG2777716.1 shikimate dehydrogenase [Desulfobacterales bacterium]